MLVELTLAVFGVLPIPANAHDVKVYDHGHRLVRVADRQADGCGTQQAFVFPRRERIVAEVVRCGHAPALGNYSRDTLHVTYNEPRTTNNEPEDNDD